MLHRLPYPDDSSNDPQRDGMFVANLGHRSSFHFNAGDRKPALNSSMSPLSAKNLSPARNVRDNDFWISDLKFCPDARFDHRSKFMASRKTVPRSPDHCGFSGQMEKRTNSRAESRVAGRGAGHPYHADTDRSLRPRPRFEAPGQPLPKPR